MSTDDADGSDGQQPPQYALRDVATDFQNHDLGGMALQGRIGFHTLYAWDTDDPTTPFQTALHMALDDVLEGLWVDEDIVEDHHGEVTPEAISETALDQMDDLTGIDFDPWTRDQFKTSLVDALEYLNDTPDEEEVDG